MFVFCPQGSFDMLQAAVVLKRFAVRVLCGIILRYYLLCICKIIDVDVWIGHFCYPLLSTLV